MQAKVYSRLFCILVMAFLWFTTLSGPALAVETFGDELFCQYGLGADLAVSGKMMSFGCTKIRGISSLGSIGSDGMTSVMQITMQVSKVVAGDYLENTLSFIVPEGMLGPRIDGTNIGVQKLHVGDSIVAILNYNDYGLGLFIAIPGPSFFRIEGDKLTPYDEEYIIRSEDPLRVLQEAAAQRDFGLIARAAEIVCIATLLGNDTQGSILSLEINSVLKGSVPSKQITLNYLHDFAMWMGLGPKFLLFLKPHNGAYVLSAGINSVYTLSGERLLRNRLPLNTTLSKVRELVQPSKEKHQ